MDQEPAKVTELNPERPKRPRGIYLLPNLLTTAALFAGFYAIVAAMADRFEARFERPGRLYRAPGRVNIIGEHTDYNDGLVLPMAIGRGTTFAVAPQLRGAGAIYLNRERGAGRDLSCAGNAAPRAGGCRACAG